jgi:hypothetical protein
MAPISSAPMLIHTTARQADPASTNRRQMSNAVGTSATTNSGTHALPSGPVLALSGSHCRQA